MSDTPSKPNVYFVDDEADILAGLRQSLRRERKRWNLQFIVCAEPALEAMQSAPPDVIVTDMRMPRMDGAVLLEKAKELYPHSLRFVLSGEASEKLSLRAVPLAHQWMSKPCSRETLVSSIDRALTLVEHIQSPELRAWIVGQEGLPSAPHAYQGIQTALRSPEADLDTVAYWIEQDPGLAARILQVTNSSFFGPRQTIVRVRDAVTMIGLRLLGEIVLAAEIVQVFPENSLATRKILQASQQVASLAHRMATELELEPQRALTAGLLHDVGRMVIAHLESGESATQPPPCDPAILGGALLQGWGLPMEIVECASFFEHPSRLPTESVQAMGLVHMAHAIVHQTEPDEAYLSAHDLTSQFQNWRDEWDSSTGQEAAA